MTARSKMQVHPAKVGLVENPVFLHDKEPQATVSNPATTTGFKAKRFRPPGGYGFHTCPGNQSALYKPVEVPK
jgi:hypothetical protein